MASRQQGSQRFNKKAHPGAHPGWAFLHLAPMLMRILVGDRLPD